MPRSGTTLLTSMINASESIYIGEETHLYEIHHLWVKENSSIPFSTYYFDHIIFRKTTYYSTNLINNMKREYSKINDPKKLISLLCNHQANIHNVNRWGEKTPMHFLYIEQIISDFPDAKFINIVRDPRDTFKSNINAGWNINPNYFWRKYKSNISIIEKYSKLGYLINLKYEDLINSPEEELRKLSDFLDLNFSKNMIYNFTKSKYHNFSPMKEPWKSNNTKKLITTNTNKWLSNPDVPINSYLAWRLKEILIILNYKYHNSNSLLINLYLEIKFAIKLILQHYKSSLTNSISNIFNRK